MYLLYAAIYEIKFVWEFKKKFPHTDMKFASVPSFRVRFIDTLFPTTSKCYQVLITCVKMCVNLAHVMLYLEYV